MSPWHRAQPGQFGYYAPPRHPGCVAFIDGERLVVEDGAPMPFQLCHRCGSHRVDWVGPLSLRLPWIEPRFRLSARAVFTFDDLFNLDERVVVVSLCGPCRRHRTVTDTFRWVAPVVAVVVGMALVPVCKGPLSSVVPALEDAAWSVALVIALAMTVGRFVVLIRRRTEHLHLRSTRQWVTPEGRPVTLLELAGFAPAAMDAVCRLCAVTPPLPRYGAGGSF